MLIKPKGTIDLYDKEANIWRMVEEVVTKVMNNYNYNYIRTPLFESSELFHRSVGESSDIVTKETYDFKDRGDRDLTLRPEGTAGVVRSYIENKMYSKSDLTKVYYFGTMYRYERPQKGRNREFSQYGVEVLGGNDSMIDALVIALSYNILKELGLYSIVVKINSLGNNTTRNNYKEALVKYLDKSIDKLCDDCQNRIKTNPLRILDCKIDKDSDVLKNAPKMNDYLDKPSSERFNKVLEYLDILGIKYEVDSNVVRGLDYYNDTVFEIEDLNIKGSQKVLCGGGRYDNLVKELDGPDTPAFGFATGIERVVSAIKEETIDKVDNTIDLYLLYVNEIEKKYGIYLTQELRNKGYKVELNYEDRSLKSQFKSVDRLNPKYSCVLNSEELDNNEITIKDNINKSSETISLDAIIYYLEEKLVDEDITIVEEDYEEEDYLDEE